MKKKYPNRKTQEAMEETEQLLADPNVKYYTDVEKALMELKDGNTTEKRLTKRRKSRII